MTDWPILMSNQRSLASSEGRPSPTKRERKIEAFESKKWINDVDFEKDLTDSKSTSGGMLYVFDDQTFCVNFKKQTTVSQIATLKLNDIIRRWS